MDDLVRWLRAQLDADERIAGAAAKEYGATWTPDERMGGVSSETGADVVDEPNAPYTFIAAHDPARVLRDIDAKRKLLAECQLAEAEAAYPDWMGGYSSGLDYAVQLVAAEYVDREGYDPEWAPRSQWGPAPSE